MPALARNLKFSVSHLRYGAQIRKPNLKLYNIGFSGPLTLSMASAQP
jgi:hypothetical protein